MSDSKFKKLKKTISKSKNKPTRPDLYARVKAEAKKKFKGDWPSAYGSAWLVKEYKKRGGGYKS